MAFTNRIALLLAAVMVAPGYNAAAQKPPRTANFTVKPGNTDLTEQVVLEGGSFTMGTNEEYRKRPALLLSLSFFSLIFSPLFSSEHKLFIKSNNSNKSSDSHNPNPDTSPTCQHVTYCFY